MVHGTCCCCKSMAAWHAPGMPSVGILMTSGRMVNVALYRTRQAGGLTGRAARYDGTGRYRYRSPAVPVDHLLPVHRRLIGIRSYRIVSSFLYMAPTYIFCCFCTSYRESFCFFFFIFLVDDGIFLHLFGDANLTLTTMFIPLE